MPRAAARAWSAAVAQRNIPKALAGDEVKALDLAAFARLIKRWPSAAQYFMCGIFGQINGASDVPGRDALVRAANRLLHHRGPDDRADFIDSHCAFGHTRLKVIDLSAAAAQPMRSASAQSVVTYNGEVYNYLDLKRDLPAPEGGWRSSSDTEVLLETLERQGVAGIRSFNGMFAFGWWRPRERELVLARDRFGKKPLYWMRTADGGLRFGSEIATLFCDGTAPRTSSGRIAEFLQYGYNLAPRTSFTGVEMLPPAHLLRARIRDDGSIDVALERYWDLPPYEPTESCEFEPWVDELQGTLSDAVKIRMRADVPVGVFLSGGVDSSVIALLASRATGGSLRTITVDFAEKEFSEAAYARDVALQLNADHRRIDVDPPTVEDIEKIVTNHGTLNGDLSVLATMAASRAGREVATVALTGDGADELMGGYSRYCLAVRAATRAQRMPRAMLRATGALARAVPPWLRGDGTLALLTDDLSQAYLSTVRQFPARQTPPLFKGPVEPWTDPIARAFAKHAERPPLPRMMAVDAETYIPGDTLACLDGASMAVALELRSPFLDYRLFEMLARARPDWIMEGDRGKRPLRYLYGSQLPESTFTRPKQGFSVPSIRWFHRAGFARQMERLLDPSAAIYEVLDRAAVRRVICGFNWRLHRSAGRLWNLLVLEAWLQRWKPAIAI